MASSGSCWSMLLLVAVAVVGSRSGAASIPSKTPGFTFGQGRASAIVQLEAFVDLLCPYSRNAYAALKQLAQEYDAEQFRLRFVLHPLPFHHQAFIVAQSAFAITSVFGENHFVPWLETMYVNQDMFYNEPTKNMSNADVEVHLRKIAMLTFPSLTRAQWDQAMAHPDINAATRESWHYVVARGLAGTPKYVLNGVPLEEADSTWTVEQWHQVIDPLIEASDSTMDAALVQNEEEALYQSWGMEVKSHFRLSDRKVYKLSTRSNMLQATQACQRLSVVRRRPCEYVPGHLMCCTVHEACLWLVGCSALA